MELGDADGHGRYGMLDETSDGLVCHECGRAFPNLGLHAWRGHGMTAAQYREAHGLQRGRGLVSSQLRQRIQTNAKARMTTPAGQAFAAARDPQRAQTARLSRPLTWTAAARASNRTASAGTGRYGTEVTCLRRGVLPPALRPQAQVPQPQLRQQLQPRPQPIGFGWQFCPGCHTQMRPDIGRS